MKRDFYKALEADSLAESLIIELSATAVSILVFNSDDSLIGYSFHSTTLKKSNEDYLSEVEKSLRMVKDEIGKALKVKLFLDNTKISFIPVKFYNAACAQEHFSLQHGQLSSASMLKETNSVNETAGIFEYNKTLRDLVIKIFGSCDLFHSYAAQASDYFTNLPVSIIFHKNYFNICVKKEGQLQIVRSFSFETEADVLYQILNSFKLLNINVEETTVGLCGAIDQSSSLYKTLNEFLFDLQLLNADVEVSDEEAPAHYFYHLLQFNKCVS